MALELAPDSPRVHLALAAYFLHAFRDYERALAELALAEEGLPGAVQMTLSKNVPVHAYLGCRLCALC